MNRRSFLKLPALIPLAALGPSFLSEEHYFQYEGVVGTSMDLVVWTPDAGLAERACLTVLDEVDRLVLILDTRNPSSEINLLDSYAGSPSRELREVFDAYNYWERRSGGVFSIRPDGPGAPRNVDALGKAYIIDRASQAVRRACPEIDALLLNIGGDIVTWGRSCKIAIADPSSWYDNASPIATIGIANAAVATSGTYARGSHLKNARSRQTLTNPTAVTVVASDAVTANALATTLCLAKADFGLQLVESTYGAEAVRIASGVLQKTSGFARLERGSLSQTPAATGWPQGYHMTVTLPLKAGRSTKRPYVAVWVEDTSGKVVRVLALWAGKSKYLSELSTSWNLLKGNQNQLRSVTRATRPPGKYDLVWDGLDEDHKPVPLGEYRITVETNQEHGTYAKQTGTISLGDDPISVTLPATTNFDAVLVQYGPA
jgi:thiamine biosynthesis lipoprotein ApbE